MALNSYRHWSKYWWANFLASSVLLMAVLLVVEDQIYFKPILHGIFSGVVIYMQNLFEVLKKKILSLIATAAIFIPIILSSIEMGGDVFPFLVYWLLITWITVSVLYGLMKSFLYGRIFDDAGNSSGYR